MPQEFAKPLVNEGAVDVAGKALACVICGAGEFVRREVKMNTGGMSFLGLDWANKSGDGVICKTCGYVHVFLGRAHQWRALD